MAVHDYLTTEVGEDSVDDVLAWLGEHLAPWG